MNQDFSEYEPSQLNEAIRGLTARINRLVEAIAISIQLNRHERWIQQIAQKLGFKLEY